MLHQLAFWKPTAQNQKGATLIEVLIVTIILAILGITGITTYRLLYARTDIENVARSVAVDMTSTRLDAVAARDAHAYGIRVYPDRYDLFYDTYDVANVYKTTNLPDNVTMTWSLEGGTDIIIFDKLTGFTDSPGSVTLESNDAAYTITISPQGIIDYQN